MGDLSVTANQIHVQVQPASVVSSKESSSVPSYHLTVKDPCYRKQKHVVVGSPSAMKSSFIQFVSLGNQPTPGNLS